MDRSDENMRFYARLLATLARREKQRPIDRSGVARSLEFSARRVEDAEKLSTNMRAVSDLMREADHWAGEDGSDVVGAEHVDKAVDTRIYRVDRVRERMHEEIGRGTILIDTEGPETGQVNGLSVVDAGTFRFGQPSRITATTRLGRGEVVDIQREVELWTSPWRWPDDTARSLPSKSRYQSFLEPKHPPGPQWGRSTGLPGDRPKTSPSEKLGTLPKIPFQTPHDQPPTTKWNLPHMPYLRPTWRTLQRAVSPLMATSPPQSPPTQKVKSSTTRAAPPRGAVQADQPVPQSINQPTQNPSRQNKKYIPQ